MFVWTGLAAGLSTGEITDRLRAFWFETWATSVVVWAPVQVAQQTMVPMKYRILVANIVSYFWDAWLSARMMVGPPPADSGPADMKVP